VNVKTIDTHGTFEQAIEGSNSEVQAIARSLREIIIEIYPEVVEVPWPHQKNVGYGVGPKKMSEHFCYLAPQRDRVNLGFFHGADLTDPAGLLEGTGKKLRHVKVKDIEQAEQASNRVLIQLSIQERKTALDITE
jgi:hypothetical protein